MYKILPEVLQLGFTATPSAMGSEDFQPPRPGGVAGADVPDSAIMWQGRWYSSTMVAVYTRGESA